MNSTTNQSAVPPHNDPDRWCVIGAGPSGLTAAKNLIQAGFHCDVFDREDDVGGNWYFGRASSSVHASTHMISSKRLTEFTDFPMPKSYPPFPSHQQALAYLRDYACHFDLYSHITFNTSVCSTTALPSGGWQVTLSTGETRSYRGLIIANGHHWDPLWAELPGEFTGELLHAHDCKTPAIFNGKKVLILGAGNSGCDLAVDAALHAESSTISLRRGYHFLPKFLLGSPIDACADWMQRWWLPLWLRRRISAWYVNIALGRPEKYGLPKPDHQLFETHPIVNSQLLYYIGHGKVAVRPAIEKVEGKQVTFSDGRCETFDLLVHATGYRVSIPFLERALILQEDGQPRLYLNVFSPQRDDLFVIGLIQPNSGLWGLADLQAKLVARYLQLRKTGRVPAWFAHAISQGRENLSGGIHYVKSERHALEVEYFSYRKKLRQLIARLSR